MVLHTDPPQAARQPSVRKPWQTQRFRDCFSGYLYIAPFFLVFGVFTVFPVLWSGYISFFSWNVLGEKEFIGFQNYVWILTDDPRFWKSVGNTFSIWIMSTVPQLFFALVIANLLNSNALRFKQFFRVGLFVPNVTSLVAVAIVFTSIFGYNYGLLNYVLNAWFGLEKTDWGASYFGAQVALSIMVMWRWTGYNAIIYLAALQSIPNDLYEAATIDGASKRQQFFHITIPMIRPMILFTVVMSTIGGMQLFVEPLLYQGAQGGSQGQVLTMVLYLYDTAFTKNSFGYASAIAWVMFLIIIVFSFFNMYLTRKIQSAN
ncbi:sugar ABC transporter permease [Paenibacillus sp.]|uniref:carbohydrate ABC transporter permease n=1 Tax=Paenibacillus sp. TaxID=58172 RepID=UPI002D631C0D|nr:sugar ABC transporter permease [Paenibacillus sp.]HZG87264.1 sugar ABC transporter permease [Paenibacillus sp.]